MDNTKAGGPAFSVKDTEASRFDYFSNNAPDVPEWFVGRVKPPEYTGPCSPLQYAPQDFKEYFRLKMRHAGIPDNLKYIGDLWEARVAAVKMHQIMCSEFVWFEWRKYYAQQMVGLIDADQRNDPDYDEE